MINPEPHWQKRTLVSQLLRPLSWLYCLATKARRAAYNHGLIPTQELPVPVIIVGNITVGGTGKTPLVIWLARYLRSQGWRPGVLTRGYGGNAKNWPQIVWSNSDPQQVGDESVLLARRCGCPVMAGPVRWISGQYLIQTYGCNILVCDDGLQHYALHRDFEIAVIDGTKRFGNKLCLPAGPLRELPQRLRDCNLVLTNGTAQPGEFNMQIQILQAVNLKNPQLTKPISEFSSENTIAMAGIGNPQRFFDTLQAQGIKPKRTLTFPDHHNYTTDDLPKAITRVVLMTEKDAVKCERLLTIPISDNYWYVPIHVLPDLAVTTKLEQWLTTQASGNK